MKTIVFDNNYRSPFPSHPAWHFIADSSLTNPGKPFFIPGFADEFVAVPSVALKINRLGKSILSKFAPRYYSDYLPVIHFMAPGLMRQLQEKGLPADRACSFDRSMFVADATVGAAAGMPALTLLKNGKPSAEFVPELMGINADEVIEAVSADNTLKMGDIIVPALPEATPVEIGDILELELYGKTILSVLIK